jgi:uncharacterized HAD superfamily protein
MDQLYNAAIAAAIPLEQVAQNVQQAIGQQDPMQIMTALLSQPHIVCDIDGTLAERDLATCLVVNARFGTSYIYDDITSPHAEDWMDNQVASGWYERYHHDPEFLKNLSPYQDGLWALWSLHQGGYQITIASDREAVLGDVSRHWLDQWGVRYDDVQIGDGEKLRLAEEASLQNPVVFFDDNPERAYDLPGPGRMLYLLDRPWNRTVPEMPNLKRVGTWQEILRDFPAQQVNVHDFFYHEMH